MTLPTVKFQSGQEASLAAFLLKLTSLDVGQARRPAIDREHAGVMDAEPRNGHMIAVGLNLNF